MQYRAKSVWIAPLLLGVVVTSEALTLGAVRGAATIGRPLEVSVPVQLAAGDDASSLCWSVEVLHGDVRQDASRVRLRVEPESSDLSVLLRISSLAVVDEPVVTLNLRTRCGQKTERRYVLLADLPSVSQEAAAGVSSAAVLKSANPEARPLASLTASDRASAEPVKPGLSAPKPQARPKAARRAPDPRRTDALAAEPLKRAGARVSAQSRLRLDNLELFSDKMSTLDLAQPDVATDEVSPSAQKVLDLEASVASLRAVAAENELRFTDMAASLRQAQTQRYPAWLVYLLAAMVLAGVAVIAVLWSRQRKTQASDEEWWNASVAVDHPPAQEVAQVRPSPGLGPTPPAAAESPAAELTRAQRVVARGVRPWEDSRDSGVDVSELEMGESKFDHFMRSDLRQASPGASVAQEFSARSVRDLNEPVSTELRQQAEFFVALGQTDQAVVILQKLIQDSEYPNPHVYLELLSLLHSLSKKAEFQRCRENFRRHFNGAVPEFACFRSEGKDLASYPEVLADLVTYWPTRQAMAHLETCIFFDPKSTGRTVFDLAAFRDLLLLHALAYANGSDEAPSRAQADPNGLPLSTAPAESNSSPDGASHGWHDRAGLVLDLDLSQGVDVSADPKGAGSNDQALPPTVSVDLELDTQGPTDSDNLIDFQMPEEPRPGQPGKKGSS